MSLRFAHRVIVVSDVLRDWLEGRYRRVNVTVIPNGVPPARVRPAGATLARYDLAARRYVFTAARFTPEKGLHDLVAAYAGLAEPGFKLVIAGDADQESVYSRWLEETARRTPGVVLTGYLSGEPLEELFSQAGLFVLPSHSEGLPIALLEAMSYGLPVLASDIPQNLAVPVPEHRIFPVGDVAGLGRKMVELMAAGISDEERSTQAALLAERYDWNGIADRTLEVYESVLR